MANNILKTRIKLAHQTEQDWINANPVLLEGEVAYSSDKGNIYKIGDGVTSWIDLPYSDYVTLQDIQVGAVNLLEDSNTLNNEDYYFSGVLSANGKVLTIGNTCFELNLGGY